ncbi:DUF362 domain-containing protein [Desulfolutivibrio sulfoxidireducens]|uniref:DUF362 domain-containing protein n=1 Tax=Desulfolutivibrio sulfoxidireducens TaxID=2773299 RepID=UPI0030841DCB
MPQRFHGDPLGRVPAPRGAGAFLSRRDFLKWQVRGALWLAAGTVGMAGAAGLAGPCRALADDTPDLALATGRPAAATRAAVGLLGGMAAFVTPGSRVVIKPNMSFPNPPEAATTTHPEVVRELVVLCREAGAARITVLDHTLYDVGACLERSGVADSCESVIRGIVHGLSDPRFYREVPIPGGASMKTTRVMADVLDADVLISAPVAKSHSSAGVSLSMKNMMGLIFDRGIMHSGHDLSVAIVDLNTLLKPALVVVDATRVLTTNGPGGPGKVDALDTVIASRDPVAADARTVVLSEWYGRRFAPRQVRHIALAHERGLGRMDVENLREARVSV